MQTRLPLRSIPVSGLALFVILATAGPLGAAGLNGWQAERVPRLRIAASPYPNYLLEVLPTGVDFGGHLFRVRIDTLGMGPSSETSRGHFYTWRAGFLDLAHIRRSIDLAGYVHYHVRETLRAEKTHFRFENIDRTTYHCDLSYPAFWNRLSPRERDRLIEELSLRIALEASFDFSNWREILTWYDFHNLPGLKEKSSAFSFEDVASHAVGLAVVRRALRDPDHPFDEAVTRELARELSRIGVVPEPVYQRAMVLTEGRWWGPKACLRRDLDTGLDDGFIDPWTVPGLTPGSDPPPVRYPAPERDDSDIAGYDCRGVFRISCEPHLRRGEILAHVLPPGETRVIPRRDYPRLLDRIAREIRDELGERATLRWP
jgi:hypothetical protein